MIYHSIELVENLMAFDKTKEAYNKMKDIKNKGSDAYKKARQAFQKQAAFAFPRLLHNDKLGIIFNNHHRGYNTTIDKVKVSVGVRGLRLTARNQYHAATLEAALEYNGVEFESRGNTAFYVQFDDGDDE